MTIATGQLKTAWIGPRKSGSLDWLFKQVTGVSHSLLEVESTEELESLRDNRLDRIIFACEDRLSYNPNKLARVASAFPEVPTAIATGEWWDGAGRTGILSADYLIVPWHRWWDTWHPWLATGVESAAHRSSLFAVAPTRLGHLRDARNVHPHPPRNQQTKPLGAIIVADCPQLSLAYQAIAESLGYSVTTLRSSVATRQSVNEQDETIHWVLWDDSCLTTSGAYSPAVPTADQQCSDFFEFAVRRWPQAQPIAAFTIPRWTLWQAAEQSGASAFITKPSTGAALARLLTFGRPNRAYVRSGV